ncbi:MAG: site-specific integrase [Fibrobacteres bacterium]|nr:site-specific integrase [Fibrobacterota bacterium]
MNLRWSDVNFESGKIFVRESKNGESREVPIHDELKKILECSRDGLSEYVVHDKGKPVTSIRRGFRMARDKAVIDDFHIHDLRHRAITRWVQEGYPSTIIMKASGHKTNSAFCRYSNLKGDDVMILVGKKTAPLPLITQGDLQEV